MSNVVAEVYDLDEVLDLKELVAIKGPCVDFKQDVVVLFLYFAEIEGEDFLLSQIAIGHLYFVLYLVYQQDLY